MTTTLYRTWRPERFADLAGQEHVSRTLLEAVKQQRIGHGYLLEGTRGTGKTTTARILARAVNCSNLEDGEPCGVCGTCRSILDGRNTDIIEVDAASNRGIDDMRELRERVMYMPVESRRKVYIIDEAHMLTSDAANAFLKTLEEPPPHVMFILCTTEANRLPATVLSRCQRFTFRMLPSGVIAQQLQMIAESESAGIGKDVAELLAQQARGSMRDANNLLEQLMVAHPMGADLPAALSMLGLDRRQDAMTVAQHLLFLKTEQALSTIGACLSDGMPAPLLHRQVLELLRAAMLMSFGAGESTGRSAEEVAALEEAVRSRDARSILRTVKVWASVNLRGAAPGGEGILLEMAAAEIGQPEPEPPPAPPERQGQGQGRPPQEQRRYPEREGQGRPPQEQRRYPEREGQGRPPQEQRRYPEREGQGSGLPARPQAAPDSDQGRWEQAVRALQRVKGSKFNLGALLRDCDPARVAFNGDRTRLILPFRNKANLDRMNEELTSPASRGMVLDAVERSFGERYDFDCVMVGGGAATRERPARDSGDPNQNPLVKAAVGLGGRVLAVGDPPTDAGT